MTTNELSLENILSILRMRMRMIGAVFILGVLVAALITYQMPEMYKAKAKLNFEFSSNDPMENQESKILTQDSYISTQIGILSSLNVAQHIVSGLNDYERQRLERALAQRYSLIEQSIFRIKRFFGSLFTSTQRDRGKKSSNANAGMNNPTIRQSLPLQVRYDRLASWIGMDLEVTPLPNSRLVEVAYSSVDPKLAAFMADLFAQVYIDTNLKMVTDPANSKKVWFDEQLKSLRTKLENAQLRLTAYQQKEGIVSSDERIDIESSRLQDFVAQLVAAQEARRNAETTQQKLAEVLNSGASVMTFEPVFNNSIVQKLKAEIRELEGRLVENSSSLGDNHPKIIQLKSELNAARSRLDAEIQSIKDGITNATELTRQRESDLERVVDEQKDLVLRLKSEHDQIAILQREVESAKATYNAALDQFNATSMLSMVNQANVSIVDHAKVPSKPATPNMPKNLAVGAFAGLLIGVGIALFQGVLIRRIHSEEDLVDGIGIPLLGHLK